MSCGGMLFLPLLFLVTKTKQTKANKQTNAKQHINKQTKGHYNIVISEDSQYGIHIHCRHGIKRIGTEMHAQHVRTRDQHFFSFFFFFRFQLTFIHHVSELLCARLYDDYNNKVYVSFDKHKSVQNSFVFYSPWYILFRVMGFKYPLCQILINVSSPHKLCHVTYVSIFIFTD